MTQPKLKPPTPINNRQTAHERRKASYEMTRSELASAYRLLIGQTQQVLEIGLYLRARRTLPAETRYLILQEALRTLEDAPERLNPEFITRNVVDYLALRARQRADEAYAEGARQNHYLIAYGLDPGL